MKVDLTKEQVDIICFALGVSSEQIKVVTTFTDKQMENLIDKFQPKEGGE